MDTIKCLRTPHGGSSHAGIYNCSTADARKCGPSQGQQRYGQHYMCLTMDHDNLEKAAQALQMALVCARMLLTCNSL